MIRVSSDTATRLRKFGADLGNSALGGLGVGLVSAGSRWGLAVLALALLGIAARVIDLRRLNPSRSLLATQLVPRALLGSGTGIALARLSPGAGQPIWAAIGVFVLVGALMYEPYLRKGSQVEVPVVAHLPGVESAPEQRDRTRTIVFGDLVVVGVGLVLGALDASAMWWALLTLVTVVTRGLMLKDSRLKAATASRLAREVPRAVAAYQPEFAVFTSWPFDASHQVTMWLPYLRRAGRRCIVITRNRIPAVALSRLVDVPVIEARGPEDLDGLVPPSMKAAFYPNASSGNGLFVRYQQLTHVFLGHGDSDKPTSYNPTHAMYDRIFASGAAAVRRYAQHGVAISPDRFELVGRPQVEAIRRTEVPISATANPVVLYAPTWRGHVEETRLSSLPLGERIVSGLLAVGATVIFRPHPFSHDDPDDAAVIQRIRRMLAADHARTSRDHQWGEAAEKARSIVDCTNDSDALISDVSSVVSDYLFSGKPIMLIAVPTDPETFKSTYPIATASYVVDGDLRDLDSALHTMLTTDPLATERVRLRTDYLGPFPAEGYSSAFVDAVTAVLDAPQQQREFDDSVDVQPGTEGGEPAVDRGTLTDPGAEDEGEAADNDAEPETRPAARSPRRVAYRARLNRYRRLLSKNRRFSQAGAALALLALAASIIGAPAAVPALLALGSVGAVYWPAQRIFARRTRWARLLCEALPTRTVLACTAMLIATSGRWSTAATIGLMFLGAALAGEAHIRKCWGRIGADVRNFPAMRSELAESLPRGVVPVVSLAVLALVVPLAALGVPAWLLLIAAVVAFPPFAIVAVRALQRAARRMAAESRMAAELTRLAPEFAVYFASNIGASYQIGMWLPYLARIGRPFVVVTRVHTTLREIAEVMERVGVIAPIIYRPTLRGLEDVIVPSMRVAFYVNNAVRNTHFVERRELTHVWLNHGDSEKPACFNPVHAIYDLIFVAGQAGIDRYARHGVSIPAEKFQIVGRPQVEMIESRRSEAPREGPPTILYAPTWQGPYADSRVFSLPVGMQIVERLLQAGARVIFRPHPFNYRFADCVTLIRRISRMLAQDREHGGREHLWGTVAESDMTIEECFNASDAMVADVSAVITDYLRSDKPFAIVSAGRAPEQLLRDAPAARAAYVLREDLSNLDEVVSGLLNSDSLVSVRRATKIYYLGGFADDRYADGFIDAARQVLDQSALAGSATITAPSAGHG